MSFQQQFGDLPAYGGLGRRTGGLRATVNAGAQCEVSKKKDAMGGNTLVNVLLSLELL